MFLPMITISVSFFFFLFNMRTQLTGIFLEKQSYGSRIRILLRETKLFSEISAKTNLFFQQFFMHFQKASDNIKVTLKFHQNISEFEEKKCPIIYLSPLSLLFYGQKSN